MQRNPMGMSDDQVAQHKAFLDYEMAVSATYERAAATMGNMTPKKWADMNSYPALDLRRLVRVRGLVA